MNTGLKLILKFDYHKTIFFFEGFWYILIKPSKHFYFLVSPIYVCCRVGLDGVICERSPPGPDENLGYLNKFGPVTYKYFIISPKLGRIFYFPGTNFYFQSVLMWLWLYYEVVPDQYQLKDRFSTASVSLKNQDTSLVRLDDNIKLYHGIVNFLSALRLLYIIIPKCMTI